MKRVAPRVGRLRVSKVVKGRCQTEHLDAASRHRVNVGGGQTVVRPQETVEVKGLSMREFRFAGLAHGSARRRFWLAWGLFSPSDAIGRHEKRPKASDARSAASADAGEQRQYGAGGEQPFGGKDGV